MRQNAKDKRKEKELQIGTTMLHLPDKAFLRKDDDDAADEKLGPNISANEAKITGRWDTTLVLASHQVSLDIISLPLILDVLGIEMVIIAIVAMGIVSWYTAYELLHFFRKHPHVVNMVNVTGVVGGVPLIIFDICVLVKICFIMDPRL
ncbi:hypothetical protein E4U55_001247 [Claviceps digitariae]|nr:hypothetical protein E4U55_001247 [Claviceps digitariae]